jgi:hypothetical protein
VEGFEGFDLYSLTDEEEVIRKFKYLFKDLIE